MPDEREVEWARAVVAAFKASDGTGAAQLNGMMLDKPHLTQALQIREAAAVSATSRSDQRLTILCANDGRTAHGCTTTASRAMIHECNHYKLSP